MTKDPVRFETKRKQWLRKQACVWLLWRVVSVCVHGRGVWRRRKITKSFAFWQHFVGVSVYTKKSLQYFLTCKIISASVITEEKKKRDNNVVFDWDVLIWWIIVVIWPEFLQTWLPVYAVWMNQLFDAGEKQYKVFLTAVT